MINEQCEANKDKPVIKKFRRTGPLDAYIYQQGRNDENVQETNQHIPAIETQEKKLHIFTDGACTQNGRKGAAAAWAFVCVNDSTRATEHQNSGRIPSNEQQTNQRAELQALLKGLTYASMIDGVKICIWSDSQYAINCASVWGPSWRKKGWIKQGGPIQHLDLIKPLVETTIAMGFRVEYKWVKAHKGGDAVHQFPWMFNHAVDKLATQALT